jgi:uncharacterized protein (DUF1697 family)
VAGRQVALLRGINVGKAKRGAKALDRALGDAVTARNWSTMLKLREMVENG